MKKLSLIICFAALLGVFEAVAQNTVDKLEMWCNITSSVKCKKNKKTAFGLYKIVIKDGTASFTPLATGDKHYAANGGGVINDGRCDFINIGGSSAELRSFNTLSWRPYTDSGEDVSDNNLVTSSAAFEASTGKIYACLTDNKGKEHGYGYVDYDNYRRTRIGFNDNHYVAMAVDGSGILYGINIKGDLHKIEKRSGEYTSVGNTGIQPSDDVQSMAFNPNDGKMYWAAASKKGNTFLCSIDVQNAKIEKVCDFTDNDVISCMFIPLQPDGKAPARLYDMDVVFEGALNKGNIMFTLPLEFYNGTIISEDIDYDVFIDDSLVGTYKGKPGEKVNVEVFVDNAGMHEFKIVLRVGENINKYNSISKWIGYDEPSPIRNLKCYTNVDKIVFLSWKAPRGGRHGGYVDMKNLVYKIVRNPGGLVVEEECTGTHYEDDVSSGGNNGFYYEVTPYVKGDKK